MVSIRKVIPFLPVLLLILAFSPRAENRGYTAPDGRIVEKTGTVNGRIMTWTYAYDGEGRLTGAKLDGRTVCDINCDQVGSLRVLPTLAAT